MESGHNQGGCGTKWRVVLLNATEICGIMLIGSLKTDAWCLADDEVKEAGKGRKQDGKNIRHNVIRKKKLQRK